MTEQPYYKICELCTHYIQTIASKDQKVCTRYPTHVERLPDDTCGEWSCARCWIPWDLVTLNDVDPSKIYIIDHSKCPEIILEPKGLLDLEGD